MKQFSIVALACLALTACAGNPQNAKNQSGKAPVKVNYEKTSYEYDPIEPWNRCVYKFNHVVDGILIKPVAKVYQTVVPKPAREGVHNALSNLTSPVSFANAVLQGNSEQAFTILWRFILNSTLGLGGLFDFAGYHGIHAKSEDFGQTMGVYGAGPGPYIVLPLLGPSSGRDVLGKVVDMVSDPFNYVLEMELIYARTAMTVIDKRANTLKLTNDVERTSLDPYATYRSGYLQYRAAEVKARR